MMVVTSCDEEEATRSWIWALKGCWWRAWGKGRQARKWARAAERGMKTEMVQRLFGTLKGNVGNNRKWWNSQPCSNAWSNWAHKLHTEEEVPTEFRLKVQDMPPGGSIYRRSWKVTTLFKSAANLYWINQSHHSELSFLTPHSLWLAKIPWIRSRFGMEPAFIWIPSTAEFIGFMWANSVSATQKEGIRSKTTEV
jgi:hypothetical protein